MLPVPPLFPETLSATVTGTLLIVTVVWPQVAAPFLAVMVGPPTPLVAVVVSGRDHVGGEGHRGGGAQGPGGWLLAPAKKPLAELEPTVRLIVAPVVLVVGLANWSRS